MDKNRISFSNKWKYDHIFEVCTQEMLDKYKAGLLDIFNENAKAVNEANKKYIKAYFEQFKTMPNLEFLNIRYELSDFTMNGDYKFKLISFG